MTPLAERLVARIRAEGPLTVADYMAACLADPRYGYYATRDPLGAAGDFTTAPEISQMFGEMVGVWLAGAWEGMGRPAPVRLVELGPGRGTLMADALRAARASGLADAAEVWLVETSPALRAQQAERVDGALWAARLEEVPEGPTLLLANEFFDALPIRQFLASAEGWRERLLGLSGDALAWGLSEPLPGESPGEGAWAELCPALETVGAEIARRIDGNGGAALILDYGYTGDRPAGPTLQAVRGHCRVDPLAAPGETDLTWLVDFGALARSLALLETAAARQGQFLAGMGIGPRAEALARARAEAADEIADALERLTSPEQMGRLFKALAAWPRGAPRPPGFGASP